MDAKILVLFIIFFMVRNKVSIFCSHGNKPGFHASLKIDGSTDLQIV